MRLVTFAITLLVAAAGAFLAGRVSDDFTLAMVVTGAWFALVALVAYLLVRRRPALALPVGGALGVLAVALTVLVGLPTLIGNSVDEEVVVGAAVPVAGGNVETAAGRFVSVAHEGRGNAAIVELPDGRRKLTITAFETDAGPDLRVYLSTEDPATAGLGSFVDLGALKGNRGDQQYDVPRDVDLGRYRVAVVWCRAFSVPFTSASLKPQGGSV